MSRDSAPPRPPAVNETDEISELREENRLLRARLSREERAEQALTELTARSNAVLEAAVDGILTIDEAGTVESVNPAACAMFGYDRDEIVGHNVKMLMPLPFRDAHDGYLANYRRTGEKKIIGIGREVVGLRKDGTTFPMELSVGEAAAGSRRVFSGIVRDITERRRTVEEQASLGRILEESRNEIFVFDDATLKFRLVNHAARENLGFTLDELREMTPIDIKPEFTEDEFRKLVDPLRSGEREVFAFRTIHRRKDGTDYRVDIRLQHEDERGEFIAVILDITDREELELQLQQAQKMEAIGTLAGGVAHDFNNLLTSIQGSAELVVGKAEPGSSMERSARRIIKAAERGEALTKQLLAFSRKQVTRPEVLDLDSAVREAAELFERMIGEDIEIEWALAATPGAIRFDPAQFDQVVINLVVNARDAMPNGGRLAISTARETVDAARAAMLEIVPGRYLRLSLRDSGSGIPPDVVPKIFDPFFTTKEKERGTGLGLSTVLGIVRQHGGAITVESEVGSGTTFTLYLPHEKDARASRVPDRPEMSATVDVSQTVLIVEDDGLLRDLMGEVLEEAGYRILSAEDPAAALELAGAHAGTLDLVVTDVVMPQMSGFALAKELTQRNGDLRVLFMSGYTEQVLADRGELSDGDAFLRKPFGNSDLREKVAKVLGSS